MAALAEAVRPILGRFGEVVTYGFSMGGYTALKYGALLGAGTAVAISPQASIDPADLAPGGTPYAAHFSPALYRAMRVRAEDLAARCTWSGLRPAPARRPGRRGEVRPGTR